MTRLKEMRKRRMLKLREVAERLNVRVQAVGNMEKQGIQTPRLALKYAKVLCCDWMEILEPPKSETPPAPRAREP